MALLAAALAAVAATLATARPALRSRPGVPVLDRKGSVALPGDRSAGTADRPARVGAPALVAGGLLVATAVVWAALPVLDGTGVAVAAVVVGATVAVVGAAMRGRRTEQARRRRQDVVDFCEALVGELRAGQPVQTALERSAAVWPEVGPAVAAARLDAHLPDALRRLARSPGAESLDHLAAAWQLCETTGGGLAAAVSQVLESVRADATALRQVDSEVSSARATARLVAGLPVVVLVAGQGLGARPWAFLLTRPAGVGCLAAGVLLVVLGLAWIDRIATSATSPES